MAVILKFQWILTIGSIQDGERFVCGFISKPEFKDLFLLEAKEDFLLSKDNARELLKNIYNSASSIVIDDIDSVSLSKLSYGRRMGYKI
jgi:hypothetical protein